MNDIVSAEEFAQILAQKCKEYTDDVRKNVRDGLVKIGKENTQEVKEISPEDFGDYKKGWTTTTKTTSRGVIQVTTHNKEYRLVHLLENGHLTRKGTGRKAGKGMDKTRAFKHVESTQNHAEEKVDALLEGL